MFILSTKRYCQRLVTQYSDSQLSTTRSWSVVNAVHSSAFHISDRTTNGPAVTVKIFHPDAVARNPRSTNHRQSSPKHVTIDPVVVSNNGKTFDATQWSADDVTVRTAHSPPARISSRGNLQDSRQHNQPWPDNSSQPSSQS